MKEPGPWCLYPTEMLSKFDVELIRSLLRVCSLENAKEDDNIRGQCDLLRWKRTEKSMNIWSRSCFVEFLVFFLFLCSSYRIVRMFFRPQTRKVINIRNQKIINLFFRKSESRSFQIASQRNYWLFLFMPQLNKKYPHKSLRPFLYKFGAQYFLYSPCSL